MLKFEPLVSVIIPCYNHDLFVKDCIKSVINQSYKNIELIVIDDGSKDCSVKAIEELVPECKKRFVRFEFRFRPNRGLSSTLNEGLDWIAGEYMSCIASDDRMLEDKTAIQVNYLESHPNTIAVFGGVKLIDNDNNIVGSIKAKEGNKTFKSMMLEGIQILAPTQMIRTEAVRKVGGYNESLLIEDGYMWLRLSQIGNLQVLSRTFSLYRRHDSNISSDLEKMHAAKFEFIDQFKDSIYYSSAIKRIKWSNALELFVYNKRRRPYYLARMLYIDPVRTVKKILKLKS